MLWNSLAARPLTPFEEDKLAEGVVKRYALHIHFEFGFGEVGIFVMAVGLLLVAIGLQIWILRRGAKEVKAQSRGRQRRAGRSSQGERGKMAATVRHVPHG